MINGVFFLIIILLLEIMAQPNFIAVGDDSGGENKHIAYSNNGLDWFKINTTIFSIQGNDVVYSQKLNRWVAVGRGSNTIAFSDNGITWFGLGSSIFSNGKGLGYSEEQNLWLAGGVGVNSTMAYSYDGINWIPNNKIFTTQCNDLLFANNTWIAVGSGTITIAISSDGFNWTTINIPGFTAYSVAYSDTLDQFVVTGTAAGANLYYSYNTITWNPVNIPISNTVSGAVWNNNKWILTGPATPQPTPFANSTDGINWFIQPPNNIMNNGYGIIYDKVHSFYIALGSISKSIIISYDGDNWFNTQYSNPFSIAGYRLASRNQFYSENILSSDIINLVTNTSKILSNATIAVIGTLNVIGDLTIDGHIIVSTASTTNVTNILTLNGNLTINMTNSIINIGVISTINTASLILSNTSQIHIDFNNQIVNNNTVITIATFNEQHGIVNIKALNIISPTSCNTAIVQPIQTSSTLTGTVVFNDVCTTTTTTISQNQIVNTADNKYMYIGIAVGVIIVGMAMGLLIIFLYKYQTAKRTKAMAAKIKEREFEAMKTAYLPNYTP